MEETSNNSLDEVQESRATEDPLAIFDPATTRASYHGQWSMSNSKVIHYALPTTTALLPPITTQEVQDEEDVVDGSTCPTGEQENLAATTKAGSWQPTSEASSSQTSQNVEMTAEIPTLEGTTRHGEGDKRTPEQQAMSSEKSTYEESLTTVSRYPEYADKENRLLTFASWDFEDIQPLRRLVEAGFWYTGDSDRVTCYCCGKTLFNWRQEDDPWREHAVWSRSCSHVQRTRGTAYIHSALTAAKEEQSALLSRAHEIAPSTGGPRYPDYQEMTERLDTFFCWEYSDIQPSEPLAQAGFFYQGLEDRVVCYQCGITLYNWEVADDPWEEHARWKPGCAHVQGHGASSKAPPAPPSAEPLEPKAAEAQTIPPEKHKEEMLTQKEESSGDKKKKKKAKSKGFRKKEEKGSEGGSPSPTGEAKELERLLEENASLRELKVCKICLSEDIAVVFVPCGHLVCCQNCSQRLSQCPLCRGRIKGIVRTFWG